VLYHYGMTFFRRNIYWLILSIFFVFDNLFSYYAVIKLNGHEANLLIAPFVEKWPILYFLCIPGEMILVWIIIRGIRQIAMKLFHFTNKLLLETIILQSIVIYWAIANSSMNFAFMIGYRQSIQRWYVVTIVGVLCAIIYFFYCIIGICERYKHG
jgi:hypothetical protein